jgi:two-component system invasion response regulator UvrY
MFMSQPAAPLHAVLIADDHAIVREGLKKIICESGQFTVNADVDSGLLAIQRVREAPYDLVLLDISLPDKNGIEVLRQIKKEFPCLPVLIISLHPESHYAMRALQAGASGYVNKKSTSTELLDAMRIAVSGLKFITPSLAQELAHSVNKDSLRAPHAALSDREYQTLIMIGAGKTVTEIAQKLSLSVKTISMYRSRLLQKMSLRNNAELTHYALRNQLVPDLP